MTSLPDFDTLQQLAQHDPDALARLRQRLIDETIQSAPPARQAQLHALQSHVDRTLQRSSNPYHGLVQVMAMMQDKLYCLALVMNEPDVYLSQQANILPFRADVNQPGDQGSNGA
ncbi:DUF3135 domain-containing protein [Ferrimonas balearica]|uniref:DUF3135 domain-containing protein n=1 Tax=Ferrimonas balearica TaxID=44012 RepID=UPI001C99F9AF|nr:DUF3135 domain-containing protein [Ferrimonas balearica]MBY5920169.1 DUF3135 domain-containing protein [Ferrimonas balearica]MBY5997146.1 DUF3135 domain-containing protein [Ferrimonas balearica]